MAFLATELRPSVKDRPPNRAPSLRMNGIDVTTPLPRKGHGPIIDSHVHLGDPDATALMIEAGRRFDVACFIGIVHLEHLDGMRKRFGSLVRFNVWTTRDRPDDPVAFARTNRDIVRRAADLGAVCIKFWYKPEFNERTGLFFDDWRLDPVFEAMRDAGLPALVHIADPNVWWQTRYADGERFERKRFTYRQLTNTLGRYPDLRVVVAHMGGFPEDLDFLDGLLTQYPNCYLDTSATK
jgi:hypothetical protein